MFLDRTQDLFSVSFCQSAPAANGREVAQMLVNFQMKPQGGDGWLRVIEMRPDHTMQIYDYSPTRNQTNASAENQFAMNLAALAKV
jgi:hypothetical protein